MRYLALAAAGVLLSNAPHSVAEQASLVRNNTEFALDVYGTLRVQDGNLFLSPYSVSTVLAMTLAGARGRTADQIAHTLHFSVRPALVRSAFGALINGTEDARL